MKNLYKKLIFILCLFVFFDPFLFSQNWSIKILNVDTASFPKVSSDFIVSGSNAALIQNLSKENINIYEGKKIIPNFSLNLVDNNKNLNVAILLDISGSMKGEKIENAKNAAYEFFHLLTQQDKATLVTFGSDIKIYSGFTNDYYILSQHLNEFHLSPKTRLYDGLLETAKLFSSFNNKRNAIILITDGRDDGSLSNLDEALAEAKQKNIEVFSLGIGKDADLQTIGRISEVTGAPYIGMVTPKDLRTILSNIYVLLTKNYKVSYVTPDSIVNVSYSTRTLSIFVNHDEISKNEQFTFAVPYYNPPRKRNWIISEIAGIGLVLVIIVGLIFLTRKKGKENVNFSTKTFESDRNKTPVFSGDEINEENSNEEETEDWTEKMKRDIKEEKTIIINKGKLRTEESLGYLVLRSKKLGMYVYEIKQREVIIGRGKQTDIFLDDQSVSRVHTKIRIVETVFFVDDLGSSNGTLVNGEVVYHAELKDGDIISIGEHELIFKCI